MLFSSASFCHVCKQFTGPASAPVPRVRVTQPSKPCACGPHTSPSCRVSALPASHTSEKVLTVLTRASSTTLPPISSQWPPSPNRGYQTLISPSPRSISTRPLTRSWQRQPQFSRQSKRRSPSKSIVCCRFPCKWLCSPEYQYCSPYSRPITIASGRMVDVSAQQSPAGPQTRQQRPEAVGRKPKAAGGASSDEREVGGGGAEATATETTRRPAPCRGRKGGRSDQLLTIHPGTHPAWLSQPGIFTRIPSHICSHKSHIL